GASSGRRMPSGRIPTESPFLLLARSDERTPDAVGAARDLEAGASGGDEASVRQVLLARWGAAATVSGDERSA
ncbi:MAG: hypothetical protein ABI620_08185, partial [Chloroflexota bacterium]